MLHLYIDTNAYLTFFHLTSDDLEELKKLQVLIAKTKDIQLHLPEQTFDEFNRNRETKIADALKRFKEEKLNNQFPQMSKEYPEYGKMRDAIKEFEQNKSKLLEKLYKDIFSMNLAADRLIDELFKNAKRYPTTEELVQIAKTRYDLGRPPGKNKSYGDAVNWEALLTNIPESEDLYFISDDKDFFSDINQDCFNSYLINEWKEKKHSDIYYYRRISEFFKEKFPNIKIASEYEKELLIKELAVRGSFAGSRATLNKISRFEDFSTEQLNDFVQACVSNRQVYWIKDDEDIKEMITEIVMPNRDKIEPSLLSEFDKVFDYKPK
jgi:hypothetical protein